MDPPARRLRRWRRPLLAAGLGLAGGVTALVVVGLGLARSAPGWWPREIEPTDAGVAAQAEALEQDVASQVHLVRPRASAPAGASGAGAPGTPGAPWRSDDWSVALTGGSANAWLAARLRAWVDAQSPGSWPAPLREVRVAFDEGVVRAGARIDLGAGRTQHVSAALVPRLDEQGRLWLVAREVTIGRLPLPPGAALDRLRDALGGATNALGAGDAAAGARADALVRVLEGAEPATDAPMIELDDGRRVRLTGVRVGADRLDLTARTEGR